LLARRSPAKCAVLALESGCNTASENAGDPKT
jgi:hypothetical protein